MPIIALNKINTMNHINLCKTGNIYSLIFVCIEISNSTQTIRMYEARLYRPSKLYCKRVRSCTFQGMYVVTVFKPAAFIFNSLGNTMIDI